MISRTVIAFAAALLSGSAYGASREENLAALIVGEGCPRQIEINALKRP